MELPEDKRSVEKEAEPLEPHKPEIVEEPEDTESWIQDIAVRRIADAIYRKRIDT